MDGFGPSDDDDYHTQTMEDNDDDDESMSETESMTSSLDEMTSTDSDSDDSIAGIDRELYAMNVASERMQVGRQLGFVPPEVNSKINSSASQSNRDAGSPPVTPRSPPHSPGTNHSDCGSNSYVGSNIRRASDLFMAVSVSAEVNKMKITELAVAAMEELTKMALKGEPLWRLQEDGKSEILNDVEYIREFRHVDATLTEIMKMVEVRHSQCLPSLDSNSEFELESEYKPLPHEIGPEPLHTEASRETGYVRINPVSIVELLMDFKHWSSLFSNIVSKAIMLGVLSSSEVEGNFDGTLQVMTAEFHVPSPLVPVRESYFARYCKQLCPGTWGVVDVSLENLFPYPSIKFRRRPSGCLIQTMPNGWSKVIWVEHVEVDNRWVHNIFQPIVISGFAYSAKRWINTIVRQCVRYATLMARSTSTYAGVLISQDGRTSLLKLSERMVRTFCVEISASTENKWMKFPIRGADDMRIMTKYSTTEDIGKPPGPSVAFATTVWLPAASPKHVFNFLRHENFRNKWDILSYGHAIRENAYVVNGEDPRNRISIMEVVASSVMYLQESYTDSTGSYVIYAPMDSYAISLVLNGGNPDNIAILPSGFAILPDRPTRGSGSSGKESSGSLVTVAFHIVDGASSEDSIPPESLDTMHHILMETAISIRTAVTPN